MSPTDKSVTPTPTQTYVPPKAKSTPTTTPTERPTHTPTRTPTVIPLPKIDVLNLFAEAGVEFPEKFETHLEKEYGEFNFRLSQNLFGNFGLDSVHLPEEIAEIMYLHAMGLYMFVARELDRQKYAEFFDLAEDIKLLTSTDDEWAWWRHRPEFEILAEQMLRHYGMVPLNFDSRFNQWRSEAHDIRFVRNLDMNFVTCEEFGKLIIFLDEINFKYIDSNPDARKPISWGEASLVIINGDTIELVACYVGHDDTPRLWPGSSFIRYGSVPPEKLSPGMDKAWYYAALLKLYQIAMINSQMNLSPTGGPDMIEWRFNIDNYDCKSNNNSTDGDTFERLEECGEATFSRNP